MWMGTTAARLPRCHDQSLDTRSRSRHAISLARRFFPHRKTDELVRIDLALDEYALGIVPKEAANLG
jgi:hypothetical protein